MGMKTEELELKRVHFIPQSDEMREGVLYYSEDFSVAVHLCPCGCGRQVVTPIGARMSGWDFKADGDGRPTLHPSVGNFQFPCRSHYFVRHGRVVPC